MASLSVRDLMTETVRAVRDDDDLALVYDMMAGGNFRHVPVIDADGTLVGLVTHRDLLRGALGQALELPVSVQRELLRQMKVRDIMIHEPDSVEPDTNLAEAAELMMMHKLGCLPVVDGDQLVGILTESDFVRHVVEAA